MRTLRTKRGPVYQLPLFLPVFQPDAAFVPLRPIQQAFGIEACIVNAFFLYKDRATRKALLETRGLREHVGLDAMIMTDSGAFQGFSRPLLLDNKVIVRFQDDIGTDITSPLDLVTPPGDRRTLAEQKMVSTLNRIREARDLVQTSTLAGVQQGGKFLDLRRRSIEGLMEIGVEYVAIGSLVPFFNQGHEMGFVGAVLREARSVIGPDIPMHVYGAGDPVELPFLVALGADIFDSSSYGHYAREGYYMTPYGALNDPGPIEAGEFACGCSVCTSGRPIREVLADTAALARHNLWTICDLQRRLRLAVRSGTVEAMLPEILERHSAWFPQSRLRPSWEALHG